MLTNNRGRTHRHPDHLTPGDDFGDLGPSERQQTRKKRGELCAVTSEFMILDGVVQAPGRPQEDTDGGFTHGGWSMPYFDR